jgi:hypothetical protein
MLEKSNFQGWQWHHHHCRAGRGKQVILSHPSMKEVLQAMRTLGWTPSEGELQVGLGI